MKPFQPLNHFIFIFLVFPFSYSNPPKPALNKERLKLLEDALSWLTLRDDGKPVDPSFNKVLVRTLHEEYNSSLYFRTIVIAFQLGVLPKLTLQQGQPCDPAYTLRYRSEINNSVTWYKIKNFTLESYYDLKKPGSPSGPYCDYRQGLVCLPTTKKCDCPEGSKMEPIEANSPVHRCLIEEDEVCPMADFVTFKDLGHVVQKLPQLIFNLEKPQSCQHGTTCRIKDSPFTRCLSLSKAPFQDNNNRPPAKYGEECVLDYIGDEGGCDVNSKAHHKASACFNFWGYLPNKRLPSSGVHKRKGFCASDFAPYTTPGTLGWSYKPGHFTDYIYYPFVSAFVNPRTVNMPSSELADYDKKLHWVTHHYNADTSSSFPREHKRIQHEVGEPCSVTDTAKMSDIWNFFAGLEKDPGQDFVADVAMLQAKLVEYSNLTENHKNYEPRICRIYWEKTKWEETQPLTCTTTGSPPDAKGNDGTCQLSNNKDTYALTLNMFNYINDDSRSKDELRNPDKFYDKVILEDNPEAVCVSRQSKRHRSYDDDNHIHGVVLEGGNCSEGFACVEDFNEIHGIYKSPKDKKDCGLVAGYQPQYTCLDLSSDRDEVRRSGCEEELLDKRVMEAVKTAPILKMGAPCNYKLGQDLNTFFWSYRYSTNRYRILLGLQTSGICDQKKLLECIKGNVCGCGESLAPRMSADKKYISDYCYRTVGRCKLSISGKTEYYFYIPLTAAEKKEVDDHYGSGLTIDARSCRNGNVCRFIDACESKCTDVNTGSTGVDVDVVGGCVPTTTTTEKPPSIIGTEEPNSSRPLEPVVPYDGAEMTLKKQSYLGVVITVIIILNM